ncbi:MAG: alternative ribosome rescue aminoacyl-tRNA hydrolase ArfB [Anaerolineales bacterium]
MIEITEGIEIHESEIDWQFSRAGGPGGQSVNKTASAVQLRFDIPASSSLSVEMKQRLQRIARNRTTKDGVLIIDASEHRSQLANRQAALDRFVQLLRRAAKPPKKRRKTKPSQAADERSLEAKRRRSEKKRRRRYDPLRDR